MKIILNKLDKIELNKLLSMEEQNIELSSLYEDYFFNNARMIKEKDIKDKLKKDNDKKKAFYLSFLNLYEIDLNEEDGYLANEYILPGISYEKLDKYLSNPYLKNVKFSKITLNNIHLVKDNYEPYEGFPLLDVQVNSSNYYQETYSIGFFDKPFYFPALNYKASTWMAIIPSEINTMEEAIKEAKGDVLVYGLGLGYYLYMISLKKEVTSITVIEKDKDIIKVFNDSLKHNFNMDKIKIINDDAFLYEQNTNKSYSFVFVDLWHGADDGLPIYLKMKSLEKLSSSYSYWLEESLLGAFRRSLITLIREALEGYTDKNYLVAKNDYDKLINSLYKEFKDKEFNSYNEIHNFLSDDNLRSIAKKIKL
jgi:hypothetical protein